MISLLIYSEAGSVSGSFRNSSKLGDILMTVVIGNIKSDRSLVIIPESEPTNENWLALELALVARSTFYILKTELLRVHQD